MKEKWWILIQPWHVIYQFSVFSSTKNTTPSTELPRDFCAGIGPLQLGVVLVFHILSIENTINYENNVFKMKTIRPAYLDF